MFEMPFFHRVIILLYQSENTITSVVFRYAAERKKESILSSFFAFTYGTISSILFLSTLNPLSSIMLINTSRSGFSTYVFRCFIISSEVIIILPANKTSHYKCPRCGGLLTKGQNPCPHCRSPFRWLRFSISYRNDKKTQGCFRCFPGRRHYDFW
jgi:hypothetical protein